MDKLCLLLKLEHWLNKSEKEPDLGDCFRGIHLLFVFASVVLFLMSALRKVLLIPIHFP